jgi:hypothetical protein
MLAVMTSNQLADKLRFIYRLAKTKGFVTIQDLDQAFPPDTVKAPYFEGVLYVIHGMGISIVTW